MSWISKSTLHIEPDRDISHATASAPVKWKQLCLWVSARDVFKESAATLWTEPAFQLIEPYTNIDLEETWFSLQLLYPPPLYQHRGLVMFRIYFSSLWSAWLSMESLKAHTQAHFLFSHSLAGPYLSVMTTDASENSTHSTLQRMVSFKDLAQL